MNSCDTMVALGNSTKSGKTIFAKNSDRSPGETQPLITVPAMDHMPGSTVKCTYAEIPQARHTYQFIGFQPYWIWGLEFGVNEHAVCIGNEAVFSKEPLIEEDVMLGMDLLRLGLERGKTAYEALHVITGLLEEYGQSGNAAVGRKVRYHNSFLIADGKEAWILETAGRRWVAAKVKGIAGISNCYSIREQWDEGSEDIKEYAYEKGWAAKGEPFDFAYVYGIVDGQQQHAYPRYRRVNKLLENRMGEIDAETMKGILRDHFEGELIESRWDPSEGLAVTVCMHDKTGNSAKTASGSVILTDGTGYEAWCCFSSPCTSFFLPVFNTGSLPEFFSTGGAESSEGSMWWRMREFNGKIEKNYRRNMESLIPIRVGLEKEFGKIAGEASAAYKKSLAEGKSGEGISYLNQAMEMCLNMALQATERIKLV